MYTINPPGPTKRLRPGNSPAIERDQPEIISRAPRAQPGTIPPRDGDSIDLIEALDQAWRSICTAYDVTAELPETPCLFEGADPRAPQAAAEIVIANMLLNALEEVGRFSPAYQKPMGLIHVRDRATNRSSWLLSPETRERWQAAIQSLAAAIERNVGLLLAADVVGEIVKSERCDESRVLACCLCLPARLILVKRSLLDHDAIICDTCQHPFHPIDSLHEAD